MIQRREFTVTSMCIAAIFCLISIGKAQNTTPEQWARQILEITGIKGGVVVHVACGDGKLTAALGAENSFLVHGLDSNADSVREARRHIHEQGLYGTVSVDRLTGEVLPYIDNLVNLVILENPDEVPANEITRVLCPEGVLCSRTGETWTKTVKPRPAEIDEWTHYLYDSTNNAVAHDSVIGPPRRYQWIGSPRWSRHHDRMASISACVSTGGRIFYIIDEGSRISIQVPSRWTLIARDAFNGTVLWKRSIASWMTQLWPFKSGPAQLPRRLVAQGDKVFVTLGLDGTALSMLDAVTGETIRTYSETEMAEEFIFSNGALFIMVKDNPPATRWNEFQPIHRTIGKAKSRVAEEWPWDEADRRLKAVAADTGDVLWEKAYPVAPLTLAADAHSVFFHDSERIICLDRTTGNELWRSSDVARRSPMPSNFGPTLVVHDDAVVFAGGDNVRTMVSLSAHTGRTLWTANYDPSGHNCPHDLLVIDGLAWAGATAGGSHSGIFKGRDLYSGVIVREFAPDVETHWFHHRCYRSRATDKYIMTSRTGVEFIDWQTEHWIPNHWVRGGCLYGIMPCNGLIYAPPHNCACYSEAKLNGFCALAPMYSERAYPAPIAEGDRLETGPAYGQIPAAPAGADDWPTYRADPERSGYTASIVPADLELSWESELQGRLTSPVIADGKVFLASTDTHTVYALNATDGAVLWSRTAGGRIDSPPTYHNGKVIFGSADGRVYCLRASDGELVWRYLAAPQDLRLPAYEQLESLWPIPGSVLVLNDIVHCVAGRSMFLDGGLRFVRLDPDTGNKLSEVVLDDRDPETNENLQIHVKGLNMPVGLPDVLSSDGERIFMRSQQFDLEGNRLRIAPYSNNSTNQASQQHGEGSHLFSPFGFLDGSWFHRSYWIYGRSSASGASGYYRAGWFAPAGRIMALDESRLYGFGRLPQYFKWTTPMEFHVFAADKAPPPTDATAAEIPKIEVANSDSLNPAGKALAVEAWVYAEEPDGVILARGGGTNGYALVVEQGRAKFVVRTGGQVNFVGATEDILDRWVHLTGVLTTGGKLQLYLDGVVAVSSQGAGFIGADPAQAMQIGADEGSSVGDYSTPFAFTGAVDEVRILHGTLTADEINEHASKSGTVEVESAELVLCMSFNSGDATDESGHNNHGEVIDAKVTAGKFGDAMRFVRSVTSGTNVRVGYHWSEKVPLFARAMVLADKMLFVAGPEDVMDEEQVFDNWSAPEPDPDIPGKIVRQDAIFSGQEGALLWVMSTANGRPVARYDLESIPVWDGMAAADGRLYVCLNNGKVQSFIGTNYPPIVEAGTSQDIYPMAEAELKATVTDDGLPKTDPDDPGSPPIGISANWVKLDGPGQAVFSDASEVETTVSFSRSGDYRLRLTAFDGSTPSYDDVNISVFGYGDVDLDRDVDISDLAGVAVKWLSIGCAPNNAWCSGADQSASGDVDFKDYAIAFANWMTGVYPAAPTKPVATPGDGSISLDWSDNTETDLAGYNVYRSSGASASYTKINAALLADSEYTDTDVINCLNYYYVVGARDKDGYESSYSPWVLASPGVQPVVRLLADVGVKTVGDSVSRWQDQAKNNDAAQSTADSRPLLAWSGINGRSAIDFYGSDRHLDVADSDDINTGGPYAGKTLIVAFKTGADVASRQVIWEQGGGSRGLSFYLDQGRLYINAWNLKETPWGPTALNAPVSGDTVYVATMLLDADSGTFAGFVNGGSIGSANGVGQLYNHSNDCALGHVEGATKFHEGANSTPADFAGLVAEFYQYNDALSVVDRQTVEDSLINRYGVDVP